MHLASLAAVLAAASPLLAQDAPLKVPTPRSLFEARADFACDPVPQIQAHLGDVIARLEARDTAELTRAQRAARRAHLERLAEYAAAGVFPRNEVAPFPTPVFIDDDGRACAVGHLMLQSGATSLARDIARSQNTAYVGELDAPGLAGWIEASGLTAEECAWIQPTYGPCGFGGSFPQYRVHCSPAAPNSNPWWSVGGALVPCGSDLVVDNNLVIWATLLPQDALGVMLVAREVVSPVNPAGSQGNLCLGGQVGRFSAPFVASYAPGGGWSAWGAPTALDLGQLPTPSGPVQVLPGDTFTFQAWYRDANPGPTSNFTDAITILFR